MRILTNAPIAEGIFSMTLTMPPGFCATPGQFAHVAVPGHILRRPISIAGFEGDVMTLIYQIVGDGTRRMTAIAPGENLDVLAPLGKGFDGITGDWYAVGGGVGVAPMLFAAKVFGCKAFYGYRNKDVAYAYEDAVVCSDDGSSGEKALVTDLLIRAIDKKRPAGIIACGPAPMLRAVKRISFLHNLPCYVSLEARMGCGVGACLTCSCKSGGTYARVCADGPVFDAREVEL